MLVLDFKFADMCAAALCKINQRLLSNLKLVDVCAAALQNAFAGSLERAAPAIKCT